MNGERFGPPGQNSRPQPGLHQGARWSRVRWHVGVALLLIAVNVAIYAPVRHFDFVQLDDPVYVSENPHVAGGLQWPSVVWAFSTVHAGYWIPLTWLSYMAEVQAFGVNPGVHHVNNLLLHIANTLLLFGLLSRLTGAAGRSAFVAALFAAHPLHVESVAWVTERKDVLSTLFALLAVWAYAAYVRRRRWDRYLLVLFLFVLGLMAKPMLVTLPVVLLLLDLWPMGRLGPAEQQVARDETTGLSRPRSRWLHLVLEKAPLLGVAAAAGIGTVVTQDQAVATLDAVPLSLRLGNAAVSGVAYIARMFWPYRLSPVYFLGTAIPGWQVALAVVILVAVSAAVIQQRSRRPYLFVGWFWYVVTLAPVSGLVQSGLQSMADRFTYVPLVGLFVIVAWGIPDLLGRSALRQGALAAAGLAAVLACAAGARAQVAHWKDSVTFWTRATELTLGVDSYNAHLSLGRVLNDQARTAEAIGHFSEAARIKPEAAAAHHGLGLALIAQGRIEDAVASLGKAVRLQPGLAEAHSDLGMTLARAGRNDEAASSLAEAVRLKPDLAVARMNLGLLLLSQGKIGQALPHLAETVRLRPDLEVARVNLGTALARAGRFEEALGEFSEALRINPANAVAQQAVNELTRLVREKGR